MEFYLTIDYRWYRYLDSSANVSISGAWNRPINRYLSQHRSHGHQTWTAWVINRLFGTTVDDDVNNRLVRALFWLLLLLLLLFLLLLLLLHVVGVISELARRCHMNDSRNIDCGLSIDIDASVSRERNIIIGRVHRLRATGALWSSFVYFPLWWVAWFAFVSAFELFDYLVWLVFFHKVHPSLSGNLNPRIDPLETPDFSLCSSAVQTFHSNWYLGEKNTTDF